MTIHKAVIPAAGLGTRMLPAAKAVPKEMLPVVDRPVIQYVAEEAADAGIQEICLVISNEKEAIEEHFRSDPELKARLTASGKLDLLESINRLSSRVRIRSVHQPHQRGLGDAVLQARSFIGSEACLCLLGDTIFSGESPARQLVDAARELGTSVIGLEEVPAEKVSRYGIVGGTMIHEGAMRIDKLVEKPDVSRAPSRLAIAARYLLTPGIFECLDQIKPGKGGEVQLTDALNLLASREPVHGIVLRGTRHDVGNPIDWLKTNLAFAARDPEVWKQIAPMVRELAEG